MLHPGRHKSKAGNRRRWATLSGVDGYDAVQSTVRVNEFFDRFVTAAVEYFHIKHRNLHTVVQS